MIIFKYIVIIILEYLSYISKKFKKIIKNILKDFVGDEMGGSGDF